MYTNVYTYEIYTYVQGNIVVTGLVKKTKVKTFPLVKLMGTSLETSEQIACERDLNDQIVRSVKANPRGFLRVSLAHIRKFIDLSLYFHKLNELDKPKQIN